MGHCIPAQYGRVFVNLMNLRAENKISSQQGQKTWECICEAWKRDNPGSYSQ